MPEPFLVYPEYLRLIQELATLEGVSGEDQRDVFGKFNELLPPTHRPSNFQLQLKVDDPDFPFERKTDRDTIYELNGENLRNKTTTLIFIATLLGADWEELQAFLNDPKMVRQAALVQSRLQEGALGASLEVQDDRYRAEITVHKGEAGILVYHKEKAEHILQRPSFRVADSADWKEFREVVRRIADAQVIASGRVFISQIGFEEAENLTRFCEVLWSDVITERLHTLNNGRIKIPRSVATFNLDRAKNSVRKLEQEIEALALDKANLVKMGAILENTLALGNTLWLIPAVVTAFRARRRADKVAALLLKEETYTSQLQRVTKEETDMGVAVSQVQSQLETLFAVAEDLSEELNTLRPSLPNLQQKVDTVQTTLLSGEVPKALLLMLDPPIDEFTGQAHGVLASPSIWSGTGVSQSTPIVPTVILDLTCRNVGEFRQAMVKSQAVANETLLMQRLAASAVSRLTQVGLSLESSRVELEENHTVLLAGVRKLGANRKAIQAELFQMSALLAAEGSRDIAFLRSEAELMYNHIDYSAREQIEELSNRGVSLAEWENEGRDRLIGEFAECSGRIRTCDERLQKAQASLVEAENEVRRFEVVLKESEERQDIERRVIVLGNFQSKVRAIKEYFAYRRSFLDSRLEKEKKHAEENRRTLGVFFNKVMNTLNERIRDRCPIAFVNHGDGRGVVPEKVLRVDFEAEDFDVENIPKSATLHSGLNSAMTILGLASRQSTTWLGSVLLVDEYRDVGVYREHIYRHLMGLPNLRLGIFVRVHDQHHGVEFTAWRPGQHDSR